VGEALEASGAAALKGNSTDSVCFQVLGRTTAYEMKVL